MSYHYAKFASIAVPAGTGLVCARVAGMDSGRHAPDASRTSLRLPAGIRP